MPKLLINYVNTIIYKIVCNDLNVNEVYVGHTTRFIKRKSHHKQTGGKWSRKYKNSINCKRPKGFSQRQYCKYSRKRH